MKMVKLCEDDSVRFVLDLSYSLVVYSSHDVRTQVALSHVQTIRL